MAPKEGRKGVSTGVSKAGITNINIGLCIEIRSCVQNVQYSYHLMSPKIGLSFKTCIVEYCIVEFA
jgi:hypothetical protein